MYQQCNFPSEVARALLFLEKFDYFLDRPCKPIFPSVAFILSLKLATFCIYSVNNVSFDTDPHRIRGDL